ncbi:MAG: primosomal replication protein N [Zoogloea sp.]|nr:primosomal replication protein N [Zoogloea sp.]
MSSNLLRIEGVLTEVAPLRYTPAGVPVAGCRLEHRSKQVEAELEREVTCEIQAVAVGQIARLLAAAKPGASARLEGFLAARSMRVRTPVLHINTIEFLEGIQDGFQAR